VTPAELGTVMTGIDEVQVWQEEFYKDLHRHPDLWGEEARTAGKVTAKLQEISVDEVMQVGGGVVGIIRNGEGRRVLFRADMDALPVTEATGLDYASTEPGKMHACGHDAHVASALGAAALLARNKSAWSGTYLALFQPGEETGKGAQAMVDDGLVAKLDSVRPDVCLAQHVLTVPVAGNVATRSGAVLSAGDSIKVTVFGKGTHGSMPHLGVDPAVLASSIVLRLQGIVSREIAPSDFGVVTVGAIKVGSAPNVISDQAELLVNVRAYDNAVRDKILQAIDRIVRAECQASGSPKEPTLETIAAFPLTVNDPQVTDTVTRAFTQAFGAARVEQLAPVPASEDFSLIPAAFGVPYTYWGNGGFLPGMPVVGNHNPAFAPAIQPTLRTGTEAAVAAALAYVGRVG
jgi:hippurate hydrolase